MVDSKKWYVYIHRKGSELSVDPEAPNQGVFYVGKGVKKRAWSVRDRNPHWKNIVKKHDYTVQIVEWFEDEQDAFGLEVYLIASYRVLDVKLANLTNGGEGVSGYVATLVQRWTSSLQGKIRFTTLEGKVHLEKMRNAYDKPEARANHSAGRRRWVSTPEGRADTAKRLAAANTPEIVAKRSASLRVKFKTDYGRTHLEKMNAAANTPESRAKQIESLRIYSQTPEGRAHTKRRVEMTNSPEIRLKRVVSMGCVPFECLQTGERFLIQRHAATRLNIDYKLLNAVLNGSQKSTNGYTFRKLSRAECCETWPAHAHLFDKAPA
jgi:hypothetical protein